MKVFSNSIALENLIVVRRDMLSMQKCPFPDSLTPSKLIINIIHNECNKLG